MNAYDQMREALEDSNGLLAELSQLGEWGDAARDQIAANKAALALPRRQCDVGTAEEQSRRFSFFCTRYHGCGKCPLNKGRKDCKFSWEQIPYEDQEGAGNERR